MRGKRDRNDVTQLFWMLQMKCVTTVVVRNGPPGFCDSDYEYFCTDKFPTQCELEEFEREACSKYTYVRWVQCFIEVVGSKEECDEAAANCCENAASETSKAALQSEEQQP